MLFNGSITELYFNDTYSTTDYYPTYRQSNFTINIALYGLASMMNGYLYEGDIGVPSSWGYFNMQDLFLGYFDNYIAFGITPKFKKYNASDFNTSKDTNTTNKTMLTASGLNCQQEAFRRQIESHQAQV